MTDELTADTSVVVPSLLDWHEHHAISRPAVEPVHRLPAHVMAEAFSVLTRLPRGLSLPPALAVDVLTEAFPGTPLVLDADDHLALLRTLADHDIRGGAVYDGVVAATARAAGAELVSLDARAAPTYRAVGVHVQVPG